MNVKLFRIGSCVHRVEVSDRIQTRTEPNGTVLVSTGSKATAILGGKMFSEGFYGWSYKDSFKQDSFS